MFVFVGEGAKELEMAETPPITVHQRGVQRGKGLSVQKKVRGKPDSKLHGCFLCVMIALCPQIHTANKILSGSCKISGQRRAKIKIKWSTSLFVFSNRKDQGMHFLLSYIGAILKVSF